MEEVFSSKAQAQVKGTINGIAYRGTLIPHGDGRHNIVVKKSIRDAKVEAGDIVKVIMVIDTEKRVVQILYAV